MKEEDRLRAELAETKTQLRETQDRLNQLAKELKVRLDQLTTGARSDFEQRLLFGLRRLVGKGSEGHDFIHEPNPVLTTKSADEILHFIAFLARRNVNADLSIKQYNKMRDALVVMLEQLPPMPEEDLIIKG